MDRIINRVFLFWDRSRPLPSSTYRLSVFLRLVGDQLTSPRSRSCARKGTWKVLERITGNREKVHRVEKKLTSGYIFWKILQIIRHFSGIFLWNLRELSLQKTCSEYFKTNNSINFHSTWRILKKDDLIEWYFTFFLLSCKDPSSIIGLISLWDFII